jgi:hypothetical protein
MGYSEIRCTGAKERGMSTKNQTRRLTDTFLLSVWVFGYKVLIGGFSVLQGIEKLVAGPKSGSDRRPSPDVAFR